MILQQSLRRGRKWEGSEYTGQMDNVQISDRCFSSLILADNTQLQVRRRGLQSAE